LLGYVKVTGAPEADAYHAISENGQTVFFTAAPTEPQIPTLYARVDNGQSGAHTVTVSAPEGVTSEQKPAIFQGASADGSKVFFTTAQPLLTSDADGTNDLYEYDFQPGGNPQLVQISAGEANPEHPIKGAGAKVLGVLRTSSDGSHVYFVAEGVLTSEPNANGEKAQLGKPNLYGYDTGTGQTKFVATLSASANLSETDNRSCPTFGPPCELWGGTTTRDHTNRSVQTTPDGRYLVFSSFAHLAKDTNNGAAYRYDFQTGELTWISHATSGLESPNENQPSIIAPLNGNDAGAFVAVNDFGRALSENGEYVVFTTSERLQADAPEGATSVYLWHNGTVSRIAAGETPAMSSSGSDVFFVTKTRLVGQDSDSLSDVYDARVGGGFPAPPAEPSCSPGACQGPPSELPSFGPSTSSVLPAGGNLPPPTNPPSRPVEKTNKPKLTPAEELARALAACKRKPRSKRAACESQARRRYAAQELATALKACKSKPKGKRAACESQARKRYRR
jgi:hypothetical protein